MANRGAAAPEVTVDMIISESRRLGPMAAPDREAMWERSAIVRRGITFYFSDGVAPPTSKPAAAGRR